MSVFFSQKLSAQVPEAVPAAAAACGTESKISSGILKLMSMEVTNNVDSLKTVDTIAEFSQLLPLAPAHQKELMESLHQHAISLTLLAAYDTPEQLFSALTTNELLALEPAVAANCARYIFALKRVGHNFRTNNNVEI